MMRWPWQAVRQHEPDASTRWVVLDVETTGLDPANAHVLSVAAIGVHGTDTLTGLEIHLSDHFEAQLRPDQASGDDNILIHGLGREAQISAAHPNEALAALSRFLDNCPVIGFHVGFDQAVLQRAWRAAALPVPQVRWLDLAPLCELAWPDRQAKNLDEWLQATGLTPLARHEAAADTLATAELLACAWPRLRSQLGSRWSDLERAVNHRRWLR